MAKSFLASQRSSYFCVFTKYCVSGRHYNKGQQLIDSLTIFLNSLTPILERIEEIFRNRNIEINLNTLEGQVRNQAIASLGASLVILQTILTNFVTFILIAVIAFLCF